jgi:hypothetical protein
VRAARAGRGGRGGGGPPPPPPPPPRDFGIPASGSRRGVERVPAEN